jgi:hypothetical protein
MKIYLTLKKLEFSNLILYMNTFFLIILYLFLAMDSILEISLFIFSLIPFLGILNIWYTLFNKKDIKKTLLKTLSTISKIIIVLIIIFITTIVLEEGISIIITNNLFQFIFYCFMICCISFLVLSLLWILWLIKKYEFFFKIYLGLLTCFSIFLVYLGITLNGFWIFKRMIFYYGPFTILPLIIIWSFYVLKNKINKKWVKIIFSIGLLFISIISIILLITLFPLWEGCGEGGCFSTNYWMSDHFILYD